MGGRKVTVRTSITGGGGEGKNRGMNECSGGGNTYMSDYENRTS